MLNRIFLLLISAIFIQCSLPEPRDEEAPVVTIINPGSVISENFTLFIEASDNEKIHKVWAYFDNILIGETSVSPYQFDVDISNFRDGQTHTIQAFASDKDGNTGQSAPVSFTVSGTEDGSPQVEITFPINTTVVNDTVIIVAEAFDNEGITSVEFYIDGLLAGSDSTAPYQHEWDTTPYANNTSHSIYGRAYDTDNKSSISTIVIVTVTNTGNVDNTPPTIAMLYPLSGNILNGTVNIAANVRDNEAVNYVEFFIDGELVFTDNNEQDGWSYTWDTSPYADGLIHSIYLRAFDINGNIGYSGVVTVTVLANSDNIPPNVLLIYPLNNSVVSGTINIVANVTDNVGVDRVEFYVDGALIFTDSDGSNGWSAAWNTATSGTGLHSVFVKAFDAADNEASSTLISVSVP
jgi:hypothetical protein